MSFRVLKLISIVYFFIGCNAIKKPINTTQSDEISEINVALYPYLFKEYEKKSKSILRELWNSKHPKIQLNFIPYNSYKEAPPANVDVFVMDALFLSSFAEKNWSLPIEKKSIKNRKDILSHSLEGCLYKEHYYGIPQFCCANILYYRKTDQVIENYTTIEAVYKIVGAALQKPI